MKQTKTKTKTKPRTIMTACDFCDKAPPSWVVAFGRDAVRIVRAKTKHYMTFGPYTVKPGPARNRLQARAIDHVLGELMPEKRLDEKSGDVDAFTILDDKRGKKCRECR